MLGRVPKIGKNQTWAGSQVKQGPKKLYVIYGSPPTLKEAQKISMFEEKIRKVHNYEVL